MLLKIHLYIRPNKVKKNGEAPIYLRLTGDTRKEYSIGYSIDLAKWDKHGYRSKGRKPEDYQLNQHIKNNTRFKHISFFRHIIREAIERGKLKDDPFAQWKGKFINHDINSTSF